MSYTAHARAGSPRLYAVVLLAAASLAAGCGDSDSSNAGTDASEGKEKAARIAYLTYTVADYQQAMVDGMKAKVVPGGGSVTQFNAQFDPQKQLQQCQDAIGSGRYDAIVIAPVTPATAVPCLTAARAADLPVINLEFPIGKDLNAVDPTLDGNVKSIVTQPSTVSKAVAELAAKACEGKSPCEVAAEVATANDPLTNDYADEVAKNPDTKVVQRIATQYDPALLAKGLTDALSAHPGIDVVVAAADFGALAVVPVLRRADKIDTVKLIGNGASRSGVDGVKDGTMFGTVGSWPRQMGELAGTAAIEAANGSKIEQPGVNAYEIDSPLVVTKDNADEMKPEWGASQ
jgi:ribose transport system substrate-binding protein